MSTVSAASPLGPQRVAAAVIVDGERVLMCHRHPDRRWYPDIWDLPGGHIEDREQPRDALIRELEEELGIVVDAADLEAGRTLMPEAGLTVHVWVVRSWMGELFNRAPDEHDTIGWFLAAEVAELDLPDRVLVDVCRDALR